MEKSSSEPSRVDGVATDLFSLATSPQSKTVYVGEDVEFQARLTEDVEGLKYQWYKGEEALAGQNSWKMALSAVTIEDSDIYRVVISRNAEILLTREATLTVVNRPVQNIQPRFVKQPSSALATVGSRVVLSVEVDGFPVPDFQWQKNGVDLPGATESSYTLENAQSTDSGLFRVVATNRVGAVTSEEVVVTINAPTCTMPNGAVVATGDSQSTGCSATCNRQASAYTAVGAITTYRCDAPGQVSQTSEPCSLFCPAAFDF